MPEQLRYSKETKRFYSIQFFYGRIADIKLGENGQGADRDADL